MADITFPAKSITIPAGTMCIFPVNIDGIRYATAQPVARRDGKIYLQQIEGIPTEIAIDGKVLKNLKPKGLDTPVYKNIYLIDRQTAERLYLEEQPEEIEPMEVTFTKTTEAGSPRKITMGVQKVAEAPVDKDFENAAVYKIDLKNMPADRAARLLEINYRGDVARLYAHGNLIADNFYNGRPMLYGIWRLPADCTELELRILPLQLSMPIYLPREADPTPGERLSSVTLR